MHWFDNRHAMTDEIMKIIVFLHRIFQEVELLRILIREACILLNILLFRVYPAALLLLPAQPSQLNQLTYVFFDPRSHVDVSVPQSKYDLIYRVTIEKGAADHTVILY